MSRAFFPYPDIACVAALTRSGKRSFACSCLVIKWAVIFWTLVYFQNKALHIKSTQSLFERCYFSATWANHKQKTSSSLNCEHIIRNNITQLGLYMMCALNHWVNQNFSEPFCLHDNVRERRLCSQGYSQYSYLEKNDENIFLQYFVFVFLLWYILKVYAKS